MVAVLLDDINGFLVHEFGANAGSDSLGASCFGSDHSCMHLSDLRSNGSVDYCSSAISIIECLAVARKDVDDDRFFRS